MIKFIKKFLNKGTSIDYVPKMITLCNRCKKEIVYTPNDILPYPIYSTLFRCSRQGIICPYCGSRTIVFPHDPTLGKGSKELERKYNEQKKSLRKLRSREVIIKW